jgi:hypothetical protein
MASCDFSSAGPVLLARAPPVSGAHRAQRTNIGLLIPPATSVPILFDYLLRALVVADFDGRQCAPPVNRRITAI